MAQQLSAQDASFYYQESAETPMHVGSVAILDPATSPYGPLDLEQLTSFYASRLHLMPMARPHAAGGQADRRGLSTEEKALGDKRRSR